MAALVKELLKDFHKLTPEIRCDLLQAIEKLYHAHVVSFDDIVLLDKYVAGWNTKELKIDTEEMDKNLERILIAIEETSKYFDKDLIHRAASNNKYPKQKLSLFTDYLTKHSKNFNDYKEIIHD